MFEQLAGSLLSRLAVSPDGTIAHELTQPGLKQKMDQIQSLRQDRIVEHRESMGMELLIPDVYFEKLVAWEPELMSPDAEIKKKAWFRFLKSPESRPFRVHERGGAKGRSVGGIEIWPETSVVP